MFEAKKHILTLVLCVMTLLTAGAETVSQKMAMRLANTFFNTMRGVQTGRPKLVWNGRELTTNRLFTPFYVYNSPQGGFVVISAESKAYPVLAYGKTGSFDKSRLGDEERLQFERFAREIELIRYDSRLPLNAKHAWENIPDYFTSAINNPYASVEFRRLTDEACQELEHIDRRNGWIMMPTAIEFDLYDPERYRDYNLDDVLAQEEEVPFSFYEDFIKELAEEERVRAAAYENILYPADPVVRYNGGGHYAISLPDEARLMRVYAVDGRRMQEKTYKGTNIVNVDLTGMGSGYYIIMAMSLNGDIYAFKLHR